MVPQSKLGAIVFVMNSDNQVLLYRRINTWYEPNKLALIGGNVDEGESPIETAKREVLEETGITINTIEHLLTVTGDNYEVHYFLTRDWNGEPTNKEPHRCGGLSWHDLNDLPEDTIDEIKKIVKTYVTPR
jgi:8-oxo-dGTP diphosphatase